MQFYCSTKNKLGKNLTPKGADKPGLERPKAVAQFDFTTGQITYKLMSTELT